MIPIDERTRLTSKIAELEQRIANQRAHIGQKDRENRELIESREELRRDKDYAEAEAQALKDRFKELEDANLTLETRLQDKGIALSELGTQNEQLREQLQDKAFNPDDPDAMFEKYLGYQLPRMKEAAAEYEALSAVDESSIRKYLLLSQQGLIDIISPAISSAGIETRDVDLIKRHMQECMRPFEDAPDYLERDKLYKIALARLNHRRKLATVLDETAEYLLDERVNLQSQIDRINVEEEQGRIDIFERERADHNLWHELYKKLSGTIERFEKEHEEAVEVVEGIRNRIKKNLKSVCLIRNGEEEQDYTITIIIPSDDEFDRTRLGIELVSEYILNEEFYDGMQPNGAGSGEALSRIQAQFMNYDNLKKMIFRFPKENIAHEELSSFQERFIRRLSEKYASSNMALLGFDLEIWDFNKHIVRRYAVNPQDSLELAVMEARAGLGTEKEAPACAVAQQEVAADDSHQFRPAMTPENLYKVLQRHGIKLDDIYMGSKRTAREIADNLIAEARKLGIALDPDDYNLHKDSSRKQALIWLMVEAGIAKSGAGFQPRKDVYLHIAETLDASEDVRKKIGDAFKLMVEKGILEVDKSETPNQYRVNPSRLVSTGAVAQEDLEETVRHSYAQSTEVTGRETPRRMLPQNQLQPASHSIETFEQLCQTLEGCGIPMDKKYKGSYMTARKLAKQVWADAQKLGLALGIEEYDFRVSASRDRALLWMLIETEIAKSGDEFNDRAKSYQNLIRLFEDSRALKEYFGNAYKRLGNLGILDVKHDGGKNCQYRINQKRIVGTQSSEKGGASFAAEGKVDAETSDDLQEFYRKLEEHSIDLDKQYIGSYRTARELARRVWTEAQRLNLSLETGNYNFNKGEESDDRLLLWLLVETEVAKNGEEMRPRSDFFGGISANFKDIPAIVIDSVYPILEKRGVLEKHTSGKKALWRVSPSRFVRSDASLDARVGATHDETPQCGPCDPDHLLSAAENQTARRFYSQLKASEELDKEFMDSHKTLRQLVDYACSEAERLGIDPDVSTYKTRINGKDVIKLLLEVEIARYGDEYKPPTQAFQNIFKLFPNVDDKFKKEVQNAFTYMTLEGVFESQGDPNIKTRKIYRLSEAKRKK